jgi:hypothetical protein
LWAGVEVTTGESGISTVSIKEYRRRTKSMDGFGSRQGALNFLKVWMIKENARMAHEDWLSAVLN